MTDINPTAIAEERYPNHAENGRAQYNAESYAACIRERELPLRERIAELEAENKRMRDALGSIVEYWNKDRNYSAMHDACWHNVNTAADALEPLPQPPTP